MVNIVIINGNLVKDPTYKEVGETRICTFSIANSGYKKEVAFYDVTAFGQVAANCATYLKKGSAVLIDGSLKQEHWKDKATGQNRLKVSLTAKSVQFLNSRSKKESRPPESPPAYGYNNNNQSSNNDNDDIPF